MCCAMLSCSVVSDALQPIDYSLPDSSVHGDSPGKNTGVGCHAFLQGISPTQGSNPGLPHYRQILYQLSHQGSPIMCISSVHFSSVTQSCLTLCDPMNCSMPDLPVHHVYSYPQMIDCNGRKEDYTAQISCFSMKGFICPQVPQLRRSDIKNIYLLV